MSAAAVVALTACAGANTVNSAPSSQPVLSATTGEKQKDATTTTSVATSSVQTTSTTNAVTTTSEVASSTFGKAEITPRSFDRVSETIKNFHR